MVEAPTLSSEEKESLEGLISEEEALAVLKCMNNQKSPGSHGFTTEFYQFFWKDIGQFLVRSINYGFRPGDMSITQKIYVWSVKKKKASIFSSKVAK